MKPDHDPANPYQPSSTELGTPSANTAATGARYLVLFWLLLAATIAYMGRNCLGVAVADEGVQAELFEMGVADAGIKWVMFAFFLGYALAQIPSGWLGHVWGVRFVLPLIAFTWSLACAAVGMATGFWSLVAFQVAFGIAQAGIFPCSAVAISRWLPSSRRAFASGTLGSFMSIGGALGAVISGFAIEGVAWQGVMLPAISWRWVFAIFAVPGVIWAVLFYLWYRNRPEEHRSVNPAELKIILSDATGTNPGKQQDGSPVPWLLVVASWDMWMICGQQFFRAAGYIFFATWFPSFLKSRGASTSASGYLTALPLLGVVAGGILGGLLVDWIWNRTGSRRLSRQGVAVAAMLACAGFITLAFFAADPLVTVFLMTASSFSAALAGSCGYAVTIEKAGQHVAPLFGAMNMSGNLGAAICPVVVGWIVESTGNWNLGLLFFVGIYISAAVCWSLFNPNGTFLEKTD